MVLNPTIFGRRQNEIATDCPVAQHPEAQGVSVLEPTIGDQMRLDRFLESMKQAGEEELREALALLAHQFFVSSPCQVRYLANEAARNLINPMGSS